MAFELPLTEEKVKPHQVTTLHLICALAFVGSGAIIVRYNYTIPMWGLATLIAGLLLTGLVIFRNKWVISAKINPIIRIVELLVSASLGIYSVVQQWKFPMGMFGTLSVCILFSLYWERSGGGKLSIVIDDEGLKLPVTARKRFIPWTEVDQVVFRFGTLTADLADNRLFQWNIDEQQKIDNQAFESYCAEKVAEHKGKRRQNDW